MAWHPTQFKMLKPRGQRLHLAHQALQMLNGGAHPSGYMAHRKITVATEHNAARTFGQRTAQGHLQGLQLGLVTAPHALPALRKLETPTSGRQQHDTKPQFARVGQGGTIEPGLPAIIHVHMQHLTHSPEIVKAAILPPPAPLSAIFRERLHEPVRIQDFGDA